VISVLKPLVYKADRGNEVNVGVRFAHSNLRGLCCSAW